MHDCIVWGCEYGMACFLYGSLSFLLVYQEMEKKQKIRKKRESKSWRTRFNHKTILVIQENRETSK